MSKRPKQAERLPTAEEIGGAGGLDEAYAVEHFLGKSVREAEALFRENDLYYLDDLGWMGPKAFCFYVPAAIAYLMSESASYQCDAVNFFHGKLERQLREHAEEIEPALPAIRDAVVYLLDHWEKFEINPEIYGDLRGNYEAILRDLKG